MVRSTFNRVAFRSTRKKTTNLMLVAELADASIRYIGALERGEKTNPSADLVSRFSIIFGVPIDDLMSASDEE